MNKVDGVKLCVDDFIDSVGYDSSAKRLNQAGVYCLSNIDSFTCDSDLVTYNSTSKRLVRYINSVVNSQSCGSINEVSYNSTSKRLVSTARNVTCVVGVQ